MKGEQILFLAVLIYFALVVGVYFKFRFAGVKGIWLSFALMAPLFILIITPMAAFGRAWRRGRGGPLSRLKDGGQLVILAYKYFPVLVGLTAQKIVEGSDLGKNRPPVRLLDIMLPCFDGLCGLMTKS